MIYIYNNCVLKTYFNDFRSRSVYKYIYVIIDDLLKFLLCKRAHARLVSRDIAIV